MLGSVLKVVEIGPGYHRPNRGWDAADLGLGQTIPGSVWMSDGQRSRETLRGRWCWCFNKTCCKAVELSHESPVGENLGLTSDLDDPLKAVQLSGGPEVQKTPGKRRSLHFG
jgi:hypothetical protein